MLYLAIIYHMHQPYYKNLLTGEVTLPWVRLHGIKDYLDMVKILENYPSIQLTFNLVPSLLEQIEDYANRTVKDKFLELSYKPAAELTKEDKELIRDKFFMANKERIILLYPRYYELYLKRERGKEFSPQDYLDLQVWFNLAWFDPYFKQNIPELKELIEKARFFTEEEKQVVLTRQIDILEEIVPTYKEFVRRGQIEVSVSPYYHPILPLVYNTNIAKEANPKAVLPKAQFSSPEDAQGQINQAVAFYFARFGIKPSGMWPSEEAVSEHILPMIIQAGINWMVTDEAILFKSLKKKKRDTRLLYQPHLLKRADGNLAVVFRDRNLSDLIGFAYHHWKTEEAVNDFIAHLENIAADFGKEDILVTVALDGENAWEYYPRDGHDFLELLYLKLSESKFLRTTTVSDYLKTHPPGNNLKRLAAGSWIFANFDKWMGNVYKRKAWEYLALARQELENSKSQIPDFNLAQKQLYIAEGSDWFWWLGEDPEGDFDGLFRTHLANFYAIIGKDIPRYLKFPLVS